MSVVIYSTRNCPFCVAAKALLESLSVKFDEIDLTNDIEKGWKFRQNIIGELYL